MRIKYSSVDEALFVMFDDNLIIKTQVADAAELDEYWIGRYLPDDTGIEVNVYYDSIGQIYIADVYYVNAKGFYVLSTDQKERGIVLEFI